MKINVPGTLSIELSDDHQSKLLDALNAHYRVGHRNHRYTHYADETGFVACTIKQHIVQILKDVLES